jgi:hypothetical protein
MEGLEKDVCSKCKGRGMIKDKDGTVHTCFDCLNSNRFEQHGKPVDTGIKW